MTGNREDYIKAIYELGGEKNRIGTKEIASSLSISPPSVSEMLKKLVEEDYIEYEIYKGVKLTRKGIKEAVRIKKRHLLWEIFLVEKLGYKWEDVHVEAELLEHVTSPKLEDLLEKYLDYPKICPHGTPLEGSEYLFEYISLKNIDVNENVIIKRFKDEKEILNFVESKNLKIGDRVKLLEKDKIIKILIDKISIEIRQDLAEKIYVKRESI